MKAVSVSKARTIHLAPSAARCFKITHDIGTHILIFLFKADAELSVSRLAQSVER